MVDECRQPIGFCFADSPIQTAATLSAGEALNQSGDVGQIAVGRYGDMVAVKGDPTQDVRLLEHVDAVVKGGKLVDRAAEALTAR